MLKVRSIVLGSVAALALGAVAAGPASAAGMTASGSIGQAYVLGASEGQALTLIDARGRILAKGAADRLGSFIFQNVAAGSGYKVRGASTTKPFKVLSTKSNPPAAFFRGIKLGQGLNYVKVRDGVELAMTVRLPAGKTLADGPFPTIIEYSGYQTAAPHDLLSALNGKDSVSRMDARSIYRCE